MDRARVLVVEDDGEVRDLLAETLTQWGYDVTAAGDGAEALTLLDGRLFDVALLDISLPGKDGLKLLEVQIADCPQRLSSCREVVPDFRTGS